MGQQTGASLLLDAYDHYTAAMRAQEEAIAHMLSGSPFEGQVRTSLEATGLLRREIGTRLDRMARTADLIKLLATTMDITPWFERNVKEITRDLTHIR